MAIYTNLPIYKASYALMLEVCRMRKDLPKDSRYTIGQELSGRIVHHLFYNYTHALFERTFIHDSYSCIKGRGTHFGIERLKHHIRSVSVGYSKPCYVLKLDMRGYFMGIDRLRLLRICRDSLERMKEHESDMAGLTWGRKLDYDFVDYLLEGIVKLDPTRGCIMLGKAEDWDSLPHEKSMLHATPGCGLPIGNLSSQLFSNVYMNLFDQYVKRTLGCRHYGRYVDDAFIVAESREHLKSLLPIISAFLESNLGLKLNPDKTRIYDASQGVEFLGAYIRPFRTYISNSSLMRIKRKIRLLPKESAVKTQSSANSLLGVMSHYDCYRIRRVLFGYRSGMNAYGRFSRDWLKFTPYGKSYGRAGTRPAPKGGY